MNASAVVASMNSVAPVAIYLLPGTAQQGGLNLFTVLLVDRDGETADAFGRGGHLEAAAVGRRAAGGVGGRLAAVQLREDLLADGLAPLLLPPGLGLGDRLLLAVLGVGFHQVAGVGEHALVVGARVVLAPQGGGDFLRERRG